MAITTHHLTRFKKEGRPIAVLTASDFPFAQILDQAGIDVILVGDSLGMVTLGYETPIPVTLDEMIHHAKAVRRGVTHALMVVDLPFMTYQASPEQAMQSAGRIMKETGTQAVKLEGGYPDIVKTIAKLVQAGIPVMGHTGLTPQSVHQMGGFRQQGRSPESAEKVMEEAIALEQAGCFAIVLEHIPSELGLHVSQKLTIPTIGIGAGAGCDGQVLVTADLLGLSDWQPKFAKVYTHLRENITEAVQTFSSEVREHRFPSE
jgi:3-methyl-2-oxobutanoate hydroxymethyltransferase